MRFYLPLLGLLLIAGNALGQQKTLKELIPGAWVLESVYDEASDGKKNDTWGPEVKGMLLFDKSGRFSLQIMAANRPKTASNTPRDPVGKLVAYFGTYTIDEAASTLTYHLEAASFPGWNGVDRTAHISIANENELSQVSAPVPAAGENVKGPLVPHLVFKRASQ
jgi:Lipocalin-like domain